MQTNLQTKAKQGNSKTAVKLPVYLDCNATSPIEPDVAKIVSHFLNEEIGNAGSRTHEYGLKAKKAVQQARQQVASVVECDQDEVLFTSGATESNNIAILGLAEYGNKCGKRHIISTAIEHKAVLEPLEHLKNKGFEITLLPPETSGLVNPAKLKAALKKETLLVSIMHVNNETGVIQNLDEFSKVLSEHDAFFHVDAAQGFGKEIDDLRSKRIDLISISSHKIYGPVGVGALVTRRRNLDRIPLTPLIFGGGQEKGLRPGTLPVALIVGLGEASHLALKSFKNRKNKCEQIKSEIIKALQQLDVHFNGDQRNVASHVLNFSVAGLDSEAVIVALKDVASFSNGSACTSQKYTPSHVLIAMGLEPKVVQGAIRLSWSHLTPAVDWELFVDRLKSIL